jgi:chemotaxis-related protein WspB
MLFLLFHLDADCYALDTSQVVELLPLLSMKKMLGSPAGIAGSLNYHGAFVPVIDLSELALGRAAPARLSTRIILARFSEPDQASRLLGLIAENATETMRAEPTDFASSGIDDDAAPYLGPMAMGRHGPVQRVELNRLLPAHLRGLLLKQAA